MSIATISYELLLLVISGFGLIRYKYQTTPFKILTLSMIATFLFSILSRIWVFKYKNNIPILQLECIANYIFYSLTYYYLFKNKTIKNLIIISIVVITLFFFINATLLQHFLKVFPTNLYFPTQILFAVFSLLLFKEMLMYPLKINITKQSVFWFNTAMLFYATTMFFNLGLSNYLGQRQISGKLSDFSIYLISYFWYFMLGIFSILIGVSLLTYNKKITAADA
jgi:hypothetical protein